MFTIGLLLGALTSGLALWVLGSLVGGWPALASLVLLGVFAFMLMLHDLEVLHLPLPQNQRQIPQFIFTRHVYSAALQFGYELGTGVRTYVPKASVYLLTLALVALNPGLLQYAVAALGFGAGRAFMAWSRFISRAGELWDRRLRRWPGVASGAACLGLVATAIPSSMLAR